MARIIQLNESQRQAILDANLAQIQACEQSARRNAVPKDRFVFFAAFDGTNNDMNDLGGDLQGTNVGQLWNQYPAAADGPFCGGYYAGLGTRGRPTRETWLPAAVTVGVIETAKKAYIEYARAASAWLEAHPRTPVTVVFTSFSRGVASAAIFCQLLYKRGLVLPYPSGKVLIKPGQTKIAAGVLFDPVATGVHGNLAFPPDVGKVLVLKAMNEYRHLFKAVDYTKQKDLVTTLGFYGNHCDIGGGYDNGLAATSLQAATRFLQKSGLAVSDVPAARRLAQGEVAVHSEEYDGNDNRIWDVYNRDGFSFEDQRLFDGKLEISPASRPNAAGSRGFTMYDDSRVTI